MAVKGKRKVQGTNLVQKSYRKEKPTNELERIVSYTTLWNEEAVEEFLEDANMPVGTTTQETVRNAMVVIGVGKEAKLEEFLLLHPDRELFTPESEQKATQKLVQSKSKKSQMNNYLGKAWVKLVAVLVLLLLVFLLVFMFLKSK